MVSLRKIANENFKRVTVRVLLTTPEGELLFLRRSKDRSHNGKWDLPGGGVDGNETFKKAALRELQEETGIKLKRLVPVTAMSEDNRLRVLFIGVVDKPKKVKLDHEHDRYRWVDGLKKRPDEMHPGTLDLLDRSKPNLKAHLKAAQMQGEHPELLALTA